MSLRPGRDARRCGRTSRVRNRERELEAARDGAPWIDAKVGVAISSHLFTGGHGTRISAERSDAPAVVDRSRSRPGAKMVRPGTVRDAGARRSDGRVGQSVGELLPQRLSTPLRFPAAQATCVPSVLLGAHAITRSLGLIAALA